MQENFVLVNVENNANLGKGFTCYCSNLNRIVGVFLSKIISYAENVTSFFNPNMMFSHKSYVETPT